MIFVFVVAGAIASSGSVFAEDILLTDGRLLQDVTVKSQTPRTIIIHHAGGLSSVAKTLLPPAALAKYPIDEAAAAEAEQRAILAREAAKKIHQQETERVALLRKSHESDVAEQKAEQAKEAAAQAQTLQSARANASSLIYDYFQVGFARGSSCSVTISEIRPMEGWAGRWSVKGSVAVRHPINTPSTSDTSQIGDPGWRKQYSNNNSIAYDSYRHRDTAEQEFNDRSTNEQPRPHDSNSSTGANAKDPQHNHRRAPSQLNFDSNIQASYRTDPEYTYILETKEFDATYSTEGAQPSIDVTMH